MGEIRDVLLNLVILDKILPKWYHIVWLHVTPRTVLVLMFENYFDDLKLFLFLFFFFYIKLHIKYPISLGR